MNQLKKFLSVVFSISLLIIFMSSCGSKAPSDSNGFCPTPGDARLMDGVLEICLIRDTKSAWFSQGPEIDALVAAGRSVTRIAASDTDAWSTFVDKLNLITDADRTLAWGNLTSTNLLANSISIASEDDPRWDSLKISIGKFQSAEANWKLALDDWAQLGIQAIRNKDSVSYEERRKATKIMNDANDKMDSIFDYEVAPNLKPFILSMLRRIGVQDETTAVKLTFEYLKNLEK